MFIFCPFKGGKCAHCGTEDGKHDYEDDVDINLLFCGSTYKGKTKDGLYTNMIKDMVGCPRFPEHRYKYKSKHRKVLR